MGRFRSKVQGARTWQSSRVFRDPARVRVKLTVDNFVTGTCQLRCTFRHLL